MAKKFNITGTCIPERHYMADQSKKLERILAMVEQGDYFTVNKPRQYGKTTMMYLLQKRIAQNKQYLCIDISFEDIDSPTYETHREFIRTVLDILHQRLTFMQETVLSSLIEKSENISNFNRLSTFFTGLINASGRKVVLMIDEVDKASNNQLFLDFLGMLRKKYLMRNEGKDFSFHSVILTGVHDIKTLKAKIRKDEKKMYNSPWNIAVDFDVDFSLFPGEISSMLEEYAGDKHVKMDIPFFAEKLFYYTSGYPFLVSYLCKLIDEKILPLHGQDSIEWQPGDLQLALQEALAKDNTNFESLIKNLENDPDLYEFVFNLVMNERQFIFNLDNPVIKFGTLYGVLREGEGKAKIHNRLYEQRIYNYLASKMETTWAIQFEYPGTSYSLDDGSLDIVKIINKFQKFMKEQGNRKDIKFIERNARLLFLAFIKPIINGKGFDFKEVQVSDEKRLDIVITYGRHRYIIELKIWHGESYHREGIRQLCDYLERQNETTGYLLIFDPGKASNRVGEWENIDVNDKKIMAAWV